MSAQQIKQEAKYYTRTPNILFESYEHLHPQEKWLYINLVYLCGKEGTRHLSLRYISDRTGISIGALSGSKNPLKNNPGMIRNLHNAGLIHAEIKRKVGRNGKESDQAQYHISIVDIWQLNLDYFTVIPKCSEYEQSNDESVQNMNASVQNMNSSSLERSENEQERSDFDTNIRLHTKTTDTYKTTEQEGIVTSASAESDAPTANIHDLQKWKEESGKHKAIKIGDKNGHDMDSSNHLMDRRDSRSQHNTSSDVLHNQMETLEAPTEKMPSVKVQQTPGAGATPPAVAPPSDSGASSQATPSKRTRKKVTQAKSAFTLTAEQEAFWTRWCSVWFNAEIKPELTETAYKHVCKLAPYVTDDDKLKSLIDYTRKDLEASGVKRRAVQLGNMVYCYSGWKQTQQKAPSEPQREEDYSDFDIYKGNGKEERAAMLALYDQWKAEGRIDMDIAI